MSKSTMQEEPYGVTIVLGLSGRRLELVGEATLEESLVAAGVEPPCGRTWAVLRGTEPVELSTPLPELAGQELSALLVSDLLDWCAADRSNLSMHKSEGSGSFAVCGLLRPGDEVVCLWSQERKRLPQRAVRLVGGFEDCVHAVTPLGRSFCISHYGVCAPNSPLCCLWASAFLEAEDYGGPRLFAVTQQAAFMLCADGELLRAGKMVNGAWGFSKRIQGSFTHLAQSAVSVAALRDDGEVLVWSWPNDTEPRLEGKAGRIWGTGKRHFPGRALLAEGGLFAADEASTIRGLDADGCSSALAALTDLVKARCGSKVDELTFGGEGWLFALLCDGTLLVQTCYDWIHGSTVALVQARLDQALSCRGCKKMVHIRCGLLLLLEDGDAVVVKIREGCKPQRLRGDVEDVLDTLPGDVESNAVQVLLRLLDGSFAWV
jgi:hypothetical protein